VRTVLALLLLALPLAPAQAAAPAAPALVLDGVRIAAGPATTQVVTVNHTAGHRARVTYWRLVAGEWVAHFLPLPNRLPPPMARSTRIYSTASMTRSAQSPEPQWSWAQPSTATGLTLSSPRLAERDAC